MDIVDDTVSVDRVSEEMHDGDSMDASHESEEAFMLDDNILCHGGQVA